MSDEKLDKHFEQWIAKKRAEVPNPNCFHLPGKTYPTEFLNSLYAEIEKLKGELTEANIRGDNASMHYQGIAARKLEEASEIKNNYWILLTHAQALASTIEGMIKIERTKRMIPEIEILGEQALAAWKEFNDKKGPR